MMLVARYLIPLLLLLASVAGAALLLVPHRILPILVWRCDWARLKSAAATLDTVYRIERLFYRYHRLFGAALLLGSGYAVIGLWGALAHGAADMGEGRLAFMALLVGNGAAWFLGIAILLRPSLLKEPERIANRWFALPPLSPALRREVKTDEPLGRHPRLAGAFILGGALYGIVNFLQHW